MIFRVGYILVLDFVIMIIDRERLVGLVLRYPHTSP
jgi:hypothetical protein